MQSAFGKRLQSVSAYTVSGILMLSANKSSAAGNCKRRLKTAHCQEHLAPLFLNDEFEITCFR